MPYGTPTPEEERSTYNAIFNHTNGSTITLSARVAPFSDVADVDAAFQAAMDLLDGSADFTLVPPASKSYPTSEEITPTP